MAWILRGLRDGIVTTRYPRRPDTYGPPFIGAIGVLSLPDPRRRGGAGGDRDRDGLALGASPSSEGDGPDPIRAEPGDLRSCCPTGAIAEIDGAEASTVRLDRGRCICCRRCVEAFPDRFGVEVGFEVARETRSALVVPESTESDEERDQIRAELRRRQQSFGRSVHLRHVDLGSDGSEEWEIAALTNPIYDIHRLGMFFTASPRHADILLVTGVGSFGMAEPLRLTYEAMPDPKIVVAIGTDAISGGLLAGGYASGGGVTSMIDVDVFVPGSPPSPFAILHGLLLAAGRLTRGSR
jgi:Ni,Fe-hydrogenase III small subunit/ferredoxin